MIQLSSDQLRVLQTLIEKALGIVIILPKEPNLDKTASALSLYLALSSRGKQVKVACPQEMTVEFNQLVGVDKIVHSINGGNGKNLVIAFPYQEGSIEKVSYNIENNTFNLIIEPREGYPVISPNDIRYSFSGGNIDLIVTIGVNNLNDLDNLYQVNQDVFASKPIINIDSHQQNQHFGKLNIIHPGISSISEIVLYLLSQLNLSLDPDIATNLLAGITSASQNFSSRETSITTFEAAIVCMKNGARKIAPSISFSQTQRLPTQKSTYPSYNPLSSSFSKPPHVTKMPQEKPKQQTMSKPHEPQTQISNLNKQQSDEAPPDWLKPKIYKGSTLL